MKINIKSLDEIMDPMPEEAQLLLLDNQFPYLHTKAVLFLRIGAEKYRKNDFFKQPPADFDTEDIEILTNGCKQIMEGNGFTRETVFQDLNVGGFYALMRMFHFESISRETERGVVLDEQRGAIDKITFQHTMDGRKATLFNFCVYPKRE
jgi:hypothetical protein